MSPTSSTSTSISQFPDLPGLPGLPGLRESVLRVSGLQDRVSAAQGPHRHPDLVAGAAVGAADVVELNVIRQTDLDPVPWRCRNPNRPESFLEIPRRERQPDGSAHSIDEWRRTMMSYSRRTRHRAIAGAVYIGALAGAAFFGGAPAATAQPPAPPPPAPPNCSPADWAGVRAGVAAATSVYLFTHPPVNDFFATLEGQSREEMQPQVQEYLDANPQVRAELEGIKQPAVDFLNRCR